MAITYLGHAYATANGNITIPAGTNLVVCATEAYNHTVTLGGTAMTVVKRNTAIGGAFFSMKNPPTGIVAQSCSNSTTRREFWFFKGAKGTGAAACTYGANLKTASITCEKLSSMVVWCNFIETSANTMTSSGSGCTRVTTTSQNSGDQIFGYGHTLTSLTCSTTADNSDSGDGVSVNIMEIVAARDIKTGSVFLSDYGVM